MPIGVANNIVKDIKNYFDFIIFEKIISKQSNFVSDRTTNMQFSIMQNEIYGCSTTPNVATFLTESSQAILTWSLLIF